MMLHKARMMEKTGGVTMKETAVDTQRCKGRGSTPLQWTVYPFKSTGEDCGSRCLVWRNLQNPRTLPLVQRARDWEERAVCLSVLQAGGGARLTQVQEKDLQAGRRRARWVTVMTLR